MSEYLEKAKEIVTTALGQLLIVLAAALTFALAQINEKVDQVQAQVSGDAAEVIERINE